MKNTDLENIVTPLNIDLFERWLVESGYDKGKTQYLINGFKIGFDLEYQGPWKCKDLSNNIPLRKDIGDETDLWNKMIKEVEVKRFAGPFEAIPYEHFVQSPVGLAPKANGQTRLIFHLSYNFKGSGSGSVNSYIPKEKCTIRYNDLDSAVDACTKYLNDNKGRKNMIWFGISDLKSAFRLIPLRSRCWKILIMKAKNPETDEWMFSIDKCLPFGSSISCAIFQRFSNALAHITRWKLKNLAFIAIINYLDNFLNIAKSEELCNIMLRIFHQVCTDLRIPLAKDKTVWVSLFIVFLGILLDGERHLLALPMEKINKAVMLLKIFLQRKKATVKEIQSLAGLLNFLHKAIYPGRAFTRRMYAKVATDHLKWHHHVNLDREFRNDCMIWLKFLSNEEMHQFC